MSSLHYLLTKRNDQASQPTFDPQSHLPPHRPQPVPGRPTQNTDNNLETLVTPDRDTHHVPTQSKIHTHQARRPWPPPPTNKRCLTNSIIISEIPVPRRTNLNLRSSSKSPQSTTQNTIPHPNTLPHSHSIAQHACQRHLAHATHHLNAYSRLTLQSTPTALQPTTTPTTTATLHHTLPTL